MPAKEHLPVWMTNSKTLPAQEQLEAYLRKQEKPTFHNGDTVELRGEYPLHRNYNIPAGERLVVVRVMDEWLDCDFFGENVVYAVSVPKKKVKFIKRGKPYRR